MTFGSGEVLVRGRRALEPAEDRSPVLRDAAPIVPLWERAVASRSAACSAWDILSEPTLDRRAESSSATDVRSVRLRALIDRHFDFVWRAARRLGLHAADADDVAQDVFIVAARRLDEVEPDRERSFLFGTLLRVAATRRRSDSRRREDLVDTVEAHRDVGLDPEELNELMSVRPLLQEILDGLPAAQHAVFVLYEMEELSLPEIADALGVPPGTVASRLRAARESFRTAARRLQVREGSNLRLVSTPPKR
jgi:RNA polymerase sigma-70 factor (ECF subfamily)